MGHTSYRINFEVASNEDFEFQLRLKDSAGAAINLSGSTLHMQIRDETGALVLDMTTANGRLTVVDMTGGLVRVFVPASAFSALARKVYRHDFTYTRNGVVQRPFAGSWALTDGVTV